MQSSSGKRRSYQRIRKFGIYACSGLTLILSSCGSFQGHKSTSPKNSSTVKILNQHVCLDANGRGRLKVGQEVHRFTFESRANSENFNMGIDIPFKGQETLVLPFAEEGIVSGTIYKKVKKSLLKRRQLKTLSLFDGLLLESAHLFSSINNSSKYCHDASCLKGILKKNEDGYEYRSQLQESSYLTVNFGKMKSSIYEYISIKGFQDKNGVSKHVLSMDLLMDSCQK